MTCLGTVRRRLVLGVVVVLVALVAGGCQSDEPSKGAVVAVRLSDFKIKLSASTVHAGKVTFQLHNAGPTVHEFVVTRTAAKATNLPIASDGLSVDEESHHMHAMGETEAVKLADVQLLTLTLTPGHYVVFCNLGGHYLGGMRADLEVTP